MSSFNDTEIIEEVNKLPIELINNLKGIHEIKNQTESDISDFNIKRYIYKLIELCENKNDIEKVSIGILTLTMCYNIKQEIVYNDYDLIYSYFKNKESR